MRESIVRQRNPCAERPVARPQVAGGRFMLLYLHTTSSLSAIFYDSCVSRTNMCVRGYVFASAGRCCYYWCFILLLRFATIVLPRCFGSSTLCVCGVLGQVEYRSLRFNAPTAAKNHRTHKLKSVLSHGETAPNMYSTPHVFVYAVLFSRQSSLSRTLPRPTHVFIASVVATPSSSPATRPIPAPWLFYSSVSRAKVCSSAHHLRPRESFVLVQSNSSPCPSPQYSSSTTLRSKSPNSASTHSSSPSSPLHVWFSFRTREHQLL